MPLFSKTFTGLTEAASVVLHWRPSSDTTGEYLQYSNGHVNMNGTYTASFSYDYDVEYTWSLYYGRYGSVTSYIDGGTVYTASPAPSPSFTVSHTATTATASISNLTSGNSVVFQVHTYAGGGIVGSASGTASGSSMSLTVSGLASSTNYTAQVLVNGVSIGYISFTTDQGEPSHSITPGDDHITIRFYNYLSTDTLTVELDGQSASRTGNGSVTISGLEPGTSYVGYVYANGVEVEVFAVTTTGTAASSDPYIFNSGMSDNSGTEAFVVVYRTKSTYTATITINGVNKGTYACNNNSTIYKFATEPYNVYTVKITINDIELETTINTTPNTGEFQWTTNIYKGAKMNSWQNPANGNTHPAPVTAEEWNRLVTLVKVKLSISIPTVTQGERMYAGPGSKIRQVADALDVKVDNGNRITAQFFLDLQDAINNK